MRLPTKECSATHTLVTRRDRMRLSWQEKCGSVTHILFVMGRNVKRLPGKEQMCTTHFLLIMG